MKRVLVIGCPGSGKSVFSIELSKRTGLPLFHLDQMNWKPDGTTVNRSVFTERLERTLEKDEWIIDGNYASNMEKRIKECDTIFFLDYDLETCLEGVQARRGKKRPDMPWIEPANHVDVDFLDFIKNYETESKPGVLKLLDEHSDKRVITFKDREESKVFLEGLPEELGLELIEDKGEYEEESLELITGFWKVHNNITQTQEEALEDFRNWTAEGHRFFLIRLGSEPVGFAHLGSRGADIDWLEDLYVKEEYQGSGIGEKTITYLESLVKEYSESMYIEVAARNLKAMKLYHRLGYDCLNTLTIRKDFQRERFDVLQQEEIAGFKLEIKKYKK